jgi:hypothetical protein
MSQKLANYLVKQRVIQGKQVERAQESLTDPSESPIAAMIRLREIDDVGLARWLAQRFALPLINLARVKIDDRARERMPSGLLETTPCLPIGIDGDVTVIAVADPMVLPEIKAAFESADGRVEVVLTTFTALWAAYRAEITETGFWDSFSEIGDETTLTTLSNAA